MITRAFTGLDSIVEAVEDERPETICGEVPGTESLLPEVALSPECAQAACGRRLGLGQHIQTHVDSDFSAAPQRRTMFVQRDPQRIVSPRPHLVQSAVDVDCRIAAGSLKTRVFLNCSRESDDGETGDGIPSAADCLGRRKFPAGVARKVTFHRFPETARPDGATASDGHADGFEERTRLLRVYYEKRNAGQRSSARGKPHRHR